MPKTVARAAQPAAPDVFPQPRLVDHESAGTRDAVVTISAAEIAQRTGVGRERLRTWERRHGFPSPVRNGSNVRRYAASDVRRIVAVSRAVERGVPLVDAIAEVQRPQALPGTALSTLGAALDHAPVAALAVTGPDPLTVAWANGLTVAAPHAPALGTRLVDAIPGFGETAAAQLADLLVGRRSEAAVIEHGDWIGSFPAPRRSLAWRLPPQVSEEPVVVVMQLPAGLPETSAASGDPLGVWVTATMDARRVLQREPGVPAVQRALTELAHGTGAIDAMLATCQRGRLRTATSVRGALPPRTVPLDREPELLAALRAGRVTWLPDGARRALGAPAGVRLVAVPMAAGGDVVGAAFLAYPGELAIPPAAAELLMGLATGIAASLQREARPVCAPPAR